MDFMTSFLIQINWKKDNYNSILVFVNWLIKMVYYKSIKITFNALVLTKVIIDMVVRHQNLSDSIVTDKSLLFTSKFRSLLYYFLNIKQKLFTVFRPQTDSQTERQKSTLEAYLRAFVNFE